MSFLLEPTYNFQQHLPNEDPSVELFSYGTYADYIKNKALFTNVTNSIDLLTKLIKLTILTIVQDNEGLTVPVISAIRQYNLDLAAETLASLTGKNKSFVIEKLLMAMIDEETIDVNIDDEIESWHINKAHSHRDSYDPKVYQLRVLREQDVTNRSLEVAGENIKKWQQEKLNPVIVSLQDTPNSRKRKTPDHHV